MKFFCSLLFLLVSCGAVAQNWSADLEKRAKGGDAAAQYQLAEAYIGGKGIAKNLTTGLDWLLRSGNQNYVPAQEYLGDIYYFGKNEYPEAARWYQKASDNGSDYATYNLSCLYHDGIGVPKDARKSAELLQKGANAGHVTSMFNLANRYQRGDGVPKDAAKAILWYTKASAKGSPGADHNLGLCYFDGYGVTRDIPKALA